jgi:hypothetical protein
MPYSVFAGVFTVLYGVVLYCTVLPVTVLCCIFIAWSLHRICQQSMANYAASQVSCPRRRLKLCCVRCWWPVQG